MNQILLTNNQNVKKNNNKYNRNNSGDMRKIIIFFGIALLIFAILIIGVFTYKAIKNNKDEKTFKKPELSIEQTETELKIIAKAEAGIDKIIYIWNNSEPIEVNMNGRTSHEEALEIPIGQNTLKVKIIDKNNEEIETEKVTNLEDKTEKPKIEVDETLGNGKIKITATDEENSISYITYKWNDEQEITIDAESEDQTTLETTIDIKRGKNTLKITAINGLAKSETIDRIFIGVNEPVIEVTRDNNYLYMKITHDMGFKSVEFTVNGQSYIYDENYTGYDSEQQELEYKFNLVEGENTVIIHAVSNEEQDGLGGETNNVEKTYKGKCNYVEE